MEKIEWRAVPDQFITYPCLGHLHFTGHRDLPLPSNATKEIQLVQTNLVNNRLKYRQFIRQKSRFPTIDPYACFQPFNEAFKALYHFIPYLQTQLRPGDIILNLWDRSGWTASMLGAWFPQQEIWTVWEGDKDILGYKGFDYWMSAARREKHLVLFADFNRPLPVASNSIAAVVGFDLLHRFHQPDLLKEIHRVCKATAPVIFPHVHLTNNFPDPFFERGCRQLHGNDYAALFATLEPLTGRKGYILSEPQAFRNNDFGETVKKTLTSDPAHNDYNGCIAWLDDRTAPFTKPWRGYQQTWTDHYLLQNPFLFISATHEIQWNTSLYGNSIEELLQRHAVYQRRIAPSIGIKIREKWREILYWALEGKTLGEIMEITCMQKGAMQQFLEEAWRLDLAQSLPVDETGFRLQTLLGKQHYIPEKAEQQLNAFWHQAVGFFGKEIWARSPDGELTYDQANELVQLTRNALLSEGLRKGDTILVCASLHHETLLVFWAAVTLGIVIAPVSPKESPSNILQQLNKFKPAMIFTNPALHAKLKNTSCKKVIMTDEVTDPAFDSAHCFEAFLEEHAGSAPVQSSSPQPEDIAVILSTTGSTGNPKAIPLTHAQLIRSGRVMTETYHWKKTDRFYGLGGLETMSGLRHATVCLAESGASCIIPQAGQGILYHTAAIQKEDVSIIASNPVFYRQLLAAGRTFTGKKLFPSLRLTLCTGNTLPASLRDEWKARTGTVLYNYYGLTETSGICIAEPPGSAATSENSIGYPAGCLVKTVDENGHDLEHGQTGELCIYGAGNFHGYFQNDQATAQVLRDGWFHTKDLAIIHGNGSISLCGRISDIIKLPSGERIELAAIDELVAGLDIVADFAVCPVKEQEKEYAALFIVPLPGTSAEEATRVIKNAIMQGIGIFAVPAMIVQTDSIPRGNHNKVLRKKLIDQLITV